MIPWRMTWNVIDSLTISKTKLRCYTTKKLKNSLNETKISHDEFNNGPPPPSPQDHIGSSGFTFSTFERSERGLQIRIGNNLGTGNCWREVLQSKCILRDIDSWFLSSLRHRKLRSWFLPWNVSVEQRSRGLFSCIFNCVSGQIRLETHTVARSHCDQCFFHHSTRRGCMCDGGKLVDTKSIDIWKCSR